MGILGIDIGTTHTKVGLFNNEGKIIRLSMNPTESHVDSSGHTFINPEKLWDSIALSIKEITDVTDEEIMVIGIASMAETGLLIDIESGKAKTELIPWYSRCAEWESSTIGLSDDPVDRFKKTGLHNSYKYGLAKILWLKNQDPSLLNNSVWLSTADYIAYMLTGKFGTDYSLAARTFAFRIDQKKWDQQWIDNFGLPSSVFPKTYPSGTTLGGVSPEVSQKLGLIEGVPVSISGHDHVCAALAVGAIKPGVVFNSMGTAETLFGTLDERPLDITDFNKGLSYGCHVLKDHYFWMGGVQASGGSLEWLRFILDESKLSYEDIHQLLSLTKSGPTGILYYPYLTGSGAPQPNRNAKGAFVGFTSLHGRGDFVKALLEGTSYEIESIRRTAEKNGDSPINKMIVVGGGTKNRHWLQIKSDITNCELIIPDFSEATLLGAALVAGIGCGLLDESNLSSIKNYQTITPNATNHVTYKAFYEKGYMLLQPALREFYNQQIAPSYEEKIKDRGLKNDEQIRC